MAWQALVFLGLAAFLGGGVWSFARDRRWPPAVALAVLAVGCLGVGALYAWQVT